MAHYAYIDPTNNLVVKVLTGVDEDVTQLDGDVEVGGSSEAWEQFYAAQPWHQGLICKRTSYNNNIRKQYAGVGFTYDDVRDEFVQPQPFPSWTLDENNDWQPPTPKPEGDYYWDENLLVWVEYDKQKN
jgi:hypothetical protein